MNTNTLPSPKTKNNQDQDDIDRSKISWFKHYRNRVIRCAVKIAWWVWAVYLPYTLFRWVFIDLMGITDKTHPILAYVLFFFFILWLSYRVFRGEGGLLETQYGHDLRLWLEKNYPLKWKTDHWFMAS